MKPLKAAKKQQKEVDEDDVAFREKQKAGMDSAYTLYIPFPLVSTLTSRIRCQGSRRNGPEGCWEGTSH